MQRIEGLTIPPAWEDVWICAKERGHVQATGRDARGRKQYRYHTKWRAVRDENKYERLLAFGEALPRVRQQVDVDLRRAVMDRSRALALAVALLDETLIRVGNREYAKTNKSFGLTTLRDEHVEVSATKVRLRFRGKSGMELDARVDNPRIARAVRRIRDLPGEELFQYVDETDTQQIVESGEVNTYLQEAAGDAITSKEFRTWGGSLVVATALLASEDASPSDLVVTAAVREAAAVLGNTPAVCRKAYVHPGLIELYLSEQLEAVREAAASEPEDPYLTEDERLFLGILRETARRRAVARG
ncbi:MAG: DNA topoisomerase IB [Coriobacteriia bacterium]|nr:DNA topoisomerase IB [Coriobacteriia bacterium]